MSAKKTYAFSKKAIVSETPTWARWMFRITFLLTTARTASDMNTDYPGVPIGYVVIMPNILPNPLRYEKITSGGQWIATTITAILTP